MGRSSVLTSAAGKGVVPGRTRRFTQWSSPYYSVITKTHFDIDRSSMIPFRAFRLAGASARSVRLVGILAILGIVGCDAATDRFAANELHGRVVSFRESTGVAAAVEDSAAVVGELFGNPDVPLLPEGFPDGLIDLENLQRAAGPVSSDREDVHFGIYRAHCVVCHGLEGGGAGPAAALQNPYPRDFRAGIFKFKSSPRGEKPLRADLTDLLVRGAPGTSMPSFARLPEEDIEAVVDYVIYLSIRGETERRLQRFAVAELGYGDERPDSSADRLLTDGEGHFQSAEIGSAVSQIITDVASAWIDARPVEVPAPPVYSAETELDAAIERGRQRFHGPVANCASCHGKDGNADAVTLDYDDWTKEQTTRLGLTPSDADQIAPLRRAGALRPRAIQPRRLAWGVYRGTADPESLYRRLVVGIDGTPMPGLLVQEATGATGVTSTEVWELVAFLLSLDGRKDLLLTPSSRQEG